VAIGALIIGDEILSGKRQDKHFTKVIEILDARGIELAWAEYLGDDPARITATLQRTFASADVVFSFGGIGGTPDDHTRQCAAAALGKALVAHPEGLKELHARFGDDINPRRIRMVEFPEGSAIVPNPYNRIPGFNVNAHWFLPGFPEMAWPMMEWVLDTKYRELHRAERPIEEAIVVRGAGESMLLDIMNAVVRDYPELKLASLPQNVEGGYLVELSVRGHAARVPVAMAYVRSEVAKLGYAFEDRPTRR
jgi:molybdopterin-biosynthesis enzyme MoeA-like protein